MDNLGGPFPFNAFAKYMKSQDPEGCVRLFSGVNIETAVEMDTVELISPLEVSMDAVWRIVTSAGEDAISLVEFQRTNDRKFVRRLAMYSYILEHQHELPVYSNVVIIPCRVFWKAKAKVSATICMTCAKRTPAIFCRITIRR
jgi:hypothetical protein